MRSLIARFLIALVVVLSGGLSEAATSFRVEVSGHGRPIILIPGKASSGDTWKTTVARYQETVHLPCADAGRLCGRTGDTPRRSSPRSATELPEYIRSQHLDHPIIVGHSLGGTMALAIAADHPDLVGPIVVVDSLPFLAGAQFQAKSVEDARANIAAMQGYMSAQTPQQYQDAAKSGAATAFMVTSPADLDLIKRLGFGHRPANRRGCDGRPDESGPSRRRRAHQRADAGARHLGRPARAAREIRHRRVARRRAADLRRSNSRSCRSYTLRWPRRLGTSSCSTTRSGSSAARRVSWRIRKPSSGREASVSERAAIAETGLLAVPGRRLGRLHRVRAHRLHA